MLIECGNFAVEGAVSRNQLCQQNRHVRIVNTQPIDNIVEVVNRAGIALPIEDIVGSQMNQRNIRRVAVEPLIEAPGPRTIIDRAPVEDFVGAPTPVPFVVEIKVGVGCGAFEISLL